MNTEMENHKQAVLCQLSGAIKEARFNIAEALRTANLANAEWWEKELQRRLVWRQRVSNW
jgi:hypothetical protein